MDGGSVDGHADEDPGVATRLATLAATRWPARLRELRDDPRRGLPYAVAAAWPLTIFASVLLVHRCEAIPLNYPSRSCIGERAFHLEVLGELGKLLVAAVLAGAVTYTLVGPRVERALDGRLGGLLFEPDRTTIAVLGVLLVLGFTLGGPLFEGLLVGSRWAFYVLAVPAYPLIGGVMLSNLAAPAFDAGRTVLPGAVVGLLEVPWALALVVVTAALSAVWLYLLASGVSRLGSALRETVAGLR